MAAFLSSIQLVSVYYTGGEREAYAPELAYIFNTNPKTGAITICLESAECDTSYLTLTVHRSVKAVTGFFGKRVVRIATALARIDLQVTSSEAQQYWVNTLTREGEPG